MKVVAASLRFVSVLALGLYALSGSAAPAPVDTFKFTEDYEQVQKKVAGEKVVVDSGTFNVDATISLDGVDIANFDEDTVVAIVVGNFTFDAVLGDDPKYKVGRKSAVFKHEILPPGPVLAGKLAAKKKYSLTVTLSWTKNALKVNLSGKTPQFEDTILAETYVGDDEGATIFESLASFQLDSAESTFNIKGRARVNVRTVGEDEDAVDLDTIALKGKGILVDK